MSQCMKSLLVYFDAVFRCCVLFVPVLVPGSARENCDLLAYSEDVELNAYLLGHEMYLHMKMGVGTEFPILEQGYIACTSTPQSL
jgi:hypothetical protein